MVLSGMIHNNTADDQLVRATDYNHNNEREDRYSNVTAQMSAVAHHNDKSVMKITQETLIASLRGINEQDVQSRLDADQTETEFTKLDISCDSDNNAQLNEADLDDERLLALCTRHVTIRTCARVYDELRDAKRAARNRRSRSVYLKASAGQGVTLTVDYIDTTVLIPKERRCTAPLVVALHGAPGSFHDFRLLIRHLARQSVRVVAPNFPEYVATVKTKTLFRHSADEKAAYLSDFFAATKIEHIDMLVSHSSAIYPSLLLIVGSNSSNNINNNNNDEHATTINTTTTTATINSNNGHDVDANQKHQSTEPIKTVKVRSLALFSPAGHRLPKSMKPEWFKCGSVRIYQNKAGRAMFQAFGSGFLTIVGVPVRVDNMDHVMLSATVMRNSNCARIIDQLASLARLKLPTLLVFSENDKLIEKEIFYEMTQFLDLDRTTFDTYDNSGNESSNHHHDVSTTNGHSTSAQHKCDEPWIRVIVFKAGGHYAYSNYAPIVNGACDRLLSRVVQHRDV